MDGSALMHIFSMFTVMGLKFKNFNFLSSFWDGRGQVRVGSLETFQGIFQIQLSAFFRFYAFSRKKAQDSESRRQMAPLAPEVRAVPRP